MITNYFVQHGLAESKDVDANRPLSEAGIEQVGKVASHLKQFNVEVRKIYHSGKLRAAQTAQIFSQVLQVTEVAEFSGMNPNDDALNIIKHIAQDAVMYVGHLPNIQVVVSNLVTNGAEACVVKFQNSAVACIEIENDVAAVKWFITPELC